MKRSEMVEDILKVICDCIEYEGVMPFYFKDLADDILNRVEEAGMLPPQVSPDMDTEFVRDLYIQFIIDRDDSVLHQWEPEEK